MSMSNNNSVLRLPGEGETLSAMGVTLIYKVTGAQSNGQWLLLEYSAPAQMPGPPAHVHKVTTEIFYVLEGSLTVQTGEHTENLGAGGVAFVPPGTPHTFSNQSDAPAKFLLVTSPAGLENYFAEMNVLLASEPVWPPQDMSKVVALMAKYDTFAPT